MGVRVSGTVVSGISVNGKRLLGLDVNGISDRVL
jgi:hypothetical protein